MMIRLLIAASAAALLAGAAQAGTSVTVQVAGKPVADVHRDIAAAARKACYQELWDEPLAFYLMSGCVRTTAAQGEAQFARAPLAVAVNVRTPTPGR